MASSTASTNPFRRKSLAAPSSTSSTSASTSSLKPALVPSSVFDADPELELHAPDSSATPRSKATKTVRVQSPPIEISAAPTTSTDSLETCSTSEPDDDADTDDPFGAETPADEPENTATLSPVGIPHNPFSKTLGDLEPQRHDVKSATDDPAQTPVHKKTHTPKPSMDVEAFSRLLLTGSTGLETAASSRPTSSGVSAHKEGSPATSPQASTQPHKKPPPPPSSRHGRSIKSVEHGPAASSPATSALPISPRRGTASSPESSRPLPITPPPPRRTRNEARIASGELPQLNTTLSQDGVKPTAKPESSARAPAPPPPRRPHQKTSAPASPAQASATLSQSSPPPPPPVVSPPADYPTGASPPQLGPPGVKAKPPPPPARNSSVRRPQSIVLSPPSMKQPSLSRQASNVSTRSHAPQPAPPPPPVPRQRAARGADSVSASMVTSPVTPATGLEFPVDSGPDIMAEITALQREVEAAMQKKSVGGG